jgi:phosphoribosyl-ATP pyrophosphohydrolase
MASALAAKLREEAQGAAEAVEQCEALIEEMADLTEVMSALMAFHGIDPRDVAEAAQQKASRHGRFETGAWLTTTSK